MLVWNVSFVIAYNDGSIKNIGVVSDKSGVRYTAGTFYDVQEAMQLPKFAQFLSAVGLGLDPVLPASVISYSYRVHAVSANGSLTVLGTNNTISPEIEYNNYSILLELSRDPGFTSLFTLPSTGGWQRPSQWLELPDVRGQQRFAGLFAIYPDANFLAVSAEGNYTVNWGDGNITNHSSGSTAYHEYTYGNISDLNEDVLGYRQVVVQIYPQAGQNLTALNVLEQHNQVGLNTQYSVPWLDIVINAPSITSLKVAPASSPYINSKLYQIAIYENSISDASNLLIYLPNLVNAYIDATNFNNMSYMLSYCYSLRTFTIINSNNVTNTNSMFKRCRSLDAISYFDTSSVTNMQEMFYECTSLETISLLNTSNVTNMSAMFSDCWSLKSIPLINTSNLTDANTMLNWCVSLNSIPLLDFSNVTNMQACFRDCYSLSEIPLLNTENVTNMQAAFQATAIKSIPLLDTSSVTNVISMFRLCEALQSIPQIDTSNVTYMDAMFDTCPLLTEVPYLNTSNVTIFGFSNVFASCYSLTVGALNGTKGDISYANCKLSATQLNAIYTGLATVTSKTITVTGNYGTTSDNPTIATAKGWTVTS